MMFPKENAWRSKKYREWVKQQPSIVSGQYGVDPHHVIGYGFGSMGSKAPDWAVIPLTRQEHNELHGDRYKWEERHGTQLELLMRFWRQNFDTIRTFL